MTILYSPATRAYGREDVPDLFNSMSYRLTHLRNFLDQLGCSIACTDRLATRDAGVIVMFKHQDKSLWRDDALPLVSIQCHVRSSGA